MSESDSMLSVGSTTEVQLLPTVKLRFATDWAVGIGGGLWSSGLLCLHFLARHQAAYRDMFRGASVLELGSGTGLAGES